jgi:hypothetical protein
MRGATAHVDFGPIADLSDLLFCKYAIQRETARTGD